MSLSDETLSIIKKHITFNKGVFIIVCILFYFYVTGLFFPEVTTRVAYEANSIVVHSKWLSLLMMVIPPFLWISISILGVCMIVLMTLSILAVKRCVLYFLKRSTTNGEEIFKKVLSLYIPVFYVFSPLVLAWYSVWIFAPKVCIRVEEFSTLLYWFGMVGVQFLGFSILVKLLFSFPKYWDTIGVIKE